jgi:hypothetical protein
MVLSGPSSIMRKVISPISNNYGSEPKFSENIFKPEKGGKKKGDEKRESSS